jgi:hypothetical protein
MIASACVIIHTKEIYGDREITIPCHRHADAFYIISQLLDSDEIDKPRTEQGFLTHDGTFLNRYDAMDEAIKCNQLPPYAKDECAELYSEDLW